MDPSAGERQADARDQGARSQDETDADRLRGVVADDALSVDLVSAYSGDRPLTEAEASLIAALKKARGEQFFPDLLYAMTHQYFAPAAAEELWNGALRHKYEMSKALDRNVQILVATLDYLTNLQHTVRSPTVVAEAHMARIVGLSMHDGLTGFFNHTTFHEILELEIRRYARHGTAASLIMADIDDFKLVNDACGHQEGDRVLAALAAAMESCTRESDVCCRYGGEEFAVILPLTDAPEAADIAERIRAKAAEVRAGARALTVSVGVASCGEDTRSARELVRKADRALYRAKKGGKNRVVAI